MSPPTDDTTVTDAGAAAAAFEPAAALGLRGVGTPAVSFDRELLAAIVESCQDAILAKALDGTILAWNPAAEAMYGYTAAEAVGRNVSLLIPPDQEDELAGILARVGAGERVEHFETQRQRRDGTLIEVSVTVSPVVDRAGRVLAASAVAPDITERKWLERLLTYQALHDPLTGLPNRILLEDRLEQALRAARRESGGVAVLFVDLDHFKSINDRRGHGAGDRALVLAAERLASVLRASDSVGRFGGDEFVVICPDVADEAAALVVAERALEILDGPCLIDGQPTLLSASVGVALGTADGDARELIRRADAAMYQAKEQGRRRMVVYGS